MIKAIKLQGFKSFQSGAPVRFELRHQQSEPVFFYGLNGAGKSAIAEVIRRHFSPEERLPSCDVEIAGEGPFRFVVYNEAFVSKVLGESVGMPGIFTLGEPDTAAQGEIDAHEQERISLDLERISLGGQLEEAERNLRTQNEKSVSQVWQAHTRFKDTAFRGCLKHGNDRQKFFQELHSVIAEANEPPSLDELEQRLRTSKGPRRRGPDSVRCRRAPSKSRRTRSGGTASTARRKAAWRPWYKRGETATGSVPGGHISTRTCAPSASRRCPRHLWRSSRSFLMERVVIGSGSLKPTQRASVPM